MDSKNAVSASVTPLYLLTNLTKGGKGNKVVTFGRGHGFGSSQRRPTAPNARLLMATDPSSKNNMQLLLH